MTEFHTYKILKREDVIFSDDFNGMMILMKWLQYKELQVPNLNGTHKGNVSNTH